MTGMVNATKFAATGQIVTGACVYHGAVAYDATGDGLVTVYNTTAATDEYQIDYVAATDEQQSNGHNVPGAGILCPNGIYATLAGSYGIIYWTR